MIAILNKMIWAVATGLLVIASIYFSKHLSFLQFNFYKMGKALFQRKEKKEGISPFRTLMLTLAGRIGVGSIAGIALAIALGGIGSLFWIWVMAIFAAILGYGETVLAILYRKKDGDQFVGGPSYYMRDGLGWKKLGGLYAIFILLSYIGGFLGIQANTITKSLHSIVVISPWLIGFILVLITAFIIFGGLERISNFTAKIVPVMAGFYLLLVGYILVKHHAALPHLFQMILADAFHFDSFLSGFLPTFFIGIQRGIFSNEAGLGTGSITASTSGTNSPSSQGYLQVLGIYITSLLICSATAFFVLTSDYQTVAVSDLNGVEMVASAFQYHFGSIGPYFLFFFILLFSFSTILTGYYDGESSLKYFWLHPRRWILFGLKIVTLGMIFLGCILSSTSLWDMVDLLVGVLAILNLLAMFCLRKELFREATKKERKD